MTSIFFLQFFSNSVIMKSLQAWQQYYAAVGQTGIAGGVPGVAPPGAGSVPTAVPQGVPAAAADVSTISSQIFIFFSDCFESSCSTAERCS